MNALDYIIKKYNIDLNKESPIEIPNAGRDDLAKLFNELDFKTGAEIGVASGEYSKKLCEANPQTKIYGIDAWEAYGEYPDYSAEELNLYYEEVKNYFASFPNYEIIKEFSMDAVKKFEDNSLDFVYIDGNHQEPYITEDITEWSKKVRSGGIISGHDYVRGSKKKEGSDSDIIRFNVVEAINKFTKDNNIKPWFVLGSKNKAPGIIRDNTRSWFWVKP